ncbi:hypothetical protein PFUGPA_03498 [Plasmodium falciparum Palo Alto/Uganda]|uniref:Uncharacterized protein n=4 Tax=Plasmodium falciparum TaxID=5833 RepID=W4IZW4_PLAFP|nr:hypothetical protein PFFCH_02850 [Plasmodium falciparum FCH/4]ETW35082.1 hypothetical protein PFTANZ_04208 [Plasmodium falciparum Tanzania (2000708)]ETW54896.1 hypothetical protein PFUGPA_03498 [Plasmodium falciparum Palo Alto/Uganda]EUR66692.1 hypothetical protein PFBG_04272 [Plasmodium falciparum 7G8]
MVFLTISMFNYINIISFVFEQSVYDIQFILKQHRKHIKVSILNYKFVEQKALYYVSICLYNI